MKTNSWGFGILRITGSWAISNGQFKAKIDYSTTLGNKSIDIIGTFGDSGTSVSGTYEAHYDGIICVGKWDASSK